MTVKTSCCASRAWASPASTQSARPGTGSGVKSPSSNAGAVRGASELAIGLRVSDMAYLLHAWNGTRARPRLAPLEDRESQAADAADSSTQASLANHWCSVRQNRQ